MPNVSQRTRIMTLALTSSDDSDDEIVSDDSYILEDDYYHAQITTVIQKLEQKIP